MQRKQRPAASRREFPVAASLKSPLRSSSGLPQKPGKQRQVGAEQTVLRRLLSYKDERINAPCRQGVHSNVEPKGGNHAENEHSNERLDEEGQRRPPPRRVSFLLVCVSSRFSQFAPLGLEPSNEREFLWRGADTKTLLNGTAALDGMGF